MSEPNRETGVSRRDVLRGGVRGAILAGLGFLAGILTMRGRRHEWVWQIDPQKCIACDLCAKSCVLEVSAVKCVHSFPMCGYCQLCTGFFDPQPNALNTGAENQLCPTGAIVRRFVEDPYYEYHIEKDLCIGCGKCVKGCTAFGNGSLHLQIEHDRCVNCNECRIAVRCPAEAIARVPSESPYLIKGKRPAT